MHAAKGLLRLAEHLLCVALQGLEPREHFQAARVCKAFQAAVRRPLSWASALSLSDRMLPSIWRVGDRVVHNSAFHTKLLNALQGRVRALTLYEEEDDHDWRFERSALVRLRPEVLRLQRFPFPDSDDEEDASDDPEASELSGMCFPEVLELDVFHGGSLGRSNLKRVPNVRKLTVWDVPFEGVELWLRNLAQLTALTSLYLHHVYDEWEQLAAAFKQLPDLRELTVHLDCWSEHRGPKEADLKSMLAVAPWLTAVVVDGHILEDHRCQPRRMAPLFAKLAKMPKLRELHLCDSWLWFNHKCIRTLLRGAPALRLVSILPPAGSGDARAIPALGGLYHALLERPADRGVQLRLSARRLAALEALPATHDQKRLDALAPPLRGALTSLAAKLRSDKARVEFSERMWDFGEDPLFRGPPSQRAVHMTGPI